MSCNCKVKENLEMRIKKIGEYAKLPEFKNGNWMDTYVREIGVLKKEDTPKEIRFDDAEIQWSKSEVSYEEGDTIFIKLGFALELLPGKELHLLPRSGTYRKYGLILTNSEGIGDDTFIGDNDEYQGMLYATRCGSVKVGERLLQMKIEDAMPKYKLIEVEEFGNKDRGGYGSSGR